MNELHNYINNSIEDLVMVGQIDNLIETSKQVILDCTLRNGAIVAANSSKPYFPKEAKNYKFVWPRDASYACLAATILDLPIQEKFFKWCMGAEGWNKTGLFYKRYRINRKRVEDILQPDQTGMVLIALKDYCRDDFGRSKKFEKLITKSAEGLCKIWKKDHFCKMTEDLWEERHCFPDLKGNFTYSLAACSKGLCCANELIPNKRWVKVSAEMKKFLLNGSKEHFFRSFGKINDDRIDASMLALVWPFEIVDAKDELMTNTVKLIEKKIVRKLGVYRYEKDEYGGWKYNSKILRKKGAGYWPLLNFFMSIYYSKCNQRRKALKYYNKVLEDLDKKRYLPEQIFSNPIEKSVSPLCWSHAMFIIASKELGFI